MRPRDTIYRLATCPFDYRRCRQMMETPTKLAWPTVMAVRDGKVLGFLSTNPNPLALVAGPLVTNGHPHPGLITLRLVEAYEVVLRLAGVSFYYFFVSRSDALKPWRDILTRLGLKPEGMDETRIWYLRRLR